MTPDAPPPPAEERMIRVVETKEDGRYLVYYRFEAPEAER